jgi:hypothetical protein
MRAVDEVSGFVSSVTSASGVTAKLSRHAPISLPISCGSSSEGVLQRRVVQAAVEVAVVADGRAERDVEVEAKHRSIAYRLSLIASIDRPMR